MGRASGPEVDHVNYSLGAGRSVSLVPHPKSEISINSLELLLLESFELKRPYYLVI